MFWTYGVVAGGSFDDMLMKRALKRDGGGGSGEIDADDNNDGGSGARLPSSWVHCFGGALGGAVHATIVCPALIIPKDVPTGAAKEAVNVALSSAGGTKPIGAHSIIPLF